MGSPLLLLVRRHVGNAAVHVVGELVAARLAVREPEIEQDLDDAVPLGVGLDELLPRRRRVAPLLELLVYPAEILPGRERELGILRRLRGERVVLRREVQASRPEVRRRELEVRLRQYSRARRGLNEPRELAGGFLVSPTLQIAEGEIEIGLAALVRSRVIALELVEAFRGILAAARIGFHAPLLEQNARELLPRGAARGEVARVGVVRAGAAETQVRLRPPAENSAAVGAGEPESVREALLRGPVVADAERRLRGENRVPGIPLDGGELVEKGPGLRVVAPLGVPLPEPRERSRAHGRGGAALRRERGDDLLGPRSVPLLLDGERAPVHRLVGEIAPGEARHEG